MRRYSAPCDAPENRAASPKMEWLSQSTLRISYSPKSVGPGAKTVMKDIDVTKTVHVTFVARD